MPKSSLPPVSVNLRAVNPALPMPESYFRNNFNTPLSNDEITEYNKFIAELSKKSGRNVQNDTMDYDMQGFYKSGLSQSSNGHMTDAFKKPNHPTFSNQSIYHGTVNPYGDRWMGGTWGGSNQPPFNPMNVYYQPTKQMLKYTHNSDEMRNYFNQNEPNVELRLPETKKTPSEAILSLLNLGR